MAAALTAALTSVASRMPLSRPGSSLRTIREGLVSLSHNLVGRMTTDHRYLRTSRYPQSDLTDRSEAARRTRPVPRRLSPHHLPCGQSLRHHPGPTRHRLWSRLQTVCCEGIHRQIFACMTIGGPNSLRPSLLVLHLAICPLRRAPWVHLMTVSENHCLNTPSRQLIILTLTQGHQAHRLPKRPCSRTVVRPSSN